MSENLKDLRSMSYEKLIENHDKLARKTVVGTNHYLNEITRRDQEKHNKVVLKYTDEMKKYSEQMKKYTLWITVMTVIMTLFTILNVII